MRSRRSSPGRPSGDTEVPGRRVTSEAPLAHLVGGSGRPEASPTTILQDTHSLEGKFCDVELPLYGVLGSSRQMGSGIKVGTTIGPLRRTGSGGSIGCRVARSPWRLFACTLRDSVRVYSISASALIHTLVASIPRKGGSARGTFTL